MLFHSDMLRFHSPLARSWNVSASGADCNPLLCRVAEGNEERCFGNRFYAARYRGLVWICAFTTHSWRCGLLISSPAARAKTAGHASWCDLLRGLTHSRALFTHSWRCGLLLSSPAARAKTAGHASWCDLLRALAHSRRCSPTAGAVRY